MRRGRLSRFTAVLVTAATTTTMVLAGPAGTAKGGGPTSVLLTSPGDGRAAALYVDDPRYADLEALLHGPGAGRAEAAQPPGTASGDYLNVTWLVHDVAIWRADRLVLDGAGGAWVMTQLSGPDAGGTPADETWRALYDGDRIRALVSSLGLVGRRPVGSADQRDVSTTPPETAPAAAAPTSVDADPGRLSLSGWRWVVPGLLLGLLLAGVGRLRGRPSTRSDHRDLVDGRPPPNGPRAPAAFGRPVAR